MCWKMKLQQGGREKKWEWQAKCFFELSLQYTISKRLEEFEAVREQLRLSDGTFGCGE